MFAIALLSSAAAVPVLHLGLAGASQQIRPASLHWLSRVGGPLSFALAAFAVLGTWLHGDITSALLGVQGWGLQLQLDALSTSLLAVIAGVGAVVLRYSSRYLGGNPRRGAFVRDLNLTLAGVSLFVLAGNLAQLGLAWVATSFALHRLLLFYRERPRARLAARKKYVVARLGDVSLIGAGALLWAAFGTADITEIAARAAVSVPPSAHAAAVLLVLAACLKSAQVPLHGWLLDVMETPTPVSALLHAGLVNAGGFIVLRFSDVVASTPAAMSTMIVVGGATAVFGVAVMGTQKRVKTKLAYSTIAQMGFMLLQCGLGAFSAAALHLVAHSVYKAHAFLSLGGIRRPLAQRANRAPRSLAWLVGSCVGVGALFLATGAALGFSPNHEPGFFVLGTTVVLGLAMSFAATVHRPGHVAAAAAATVGLSALYFGLQHAAMSFYGTTLASLTALPAELFSLGALVLLGFVAIAFVQWAARFGSFRSLDRSVALRRGLYFNVLFDRLLSSPRPGTPSSTSSSR